jgi:hypothetical protein
MKVVVVGLGIQGRKRLRIAGADAVATVDPVVTDAAYRRIEDVPPTRTRRAHCVCRTGKSPLLEYLCRAGSTSWSKSRCFRKPRHLARLKGARAANGVAC